jgi:hypothetical protein
MTKIQLTDVEKFKEDNSLCILVFGDTTSILTKSLFTLMSSLGCEVRVLDTEENLLSYSTFRIRTTPMVHVYKNSEIVGTFTLPIDIEGITRCLAQ